MTNKTRAGASVLIALGGLMAALVLLLAGPASADPSSVGPNAVNNSTSSGAGVAINDSTASGHGVAINGSTSSGCAEAADVSTASGGTCHPAAEVAKPVPAASLAFTGTSTTGPLALVAAAFVALGAGLVVASRRSQLADR